MDKPKKSVKKSKKIPQAPTSGSLTDQEIDDMVSHLWDHIGSLPAHIQDLLIASQEDGVEGHVSYVLATGWALGKLDYVHPNPWDTASKGGWISISGSVN